MRTQPRFPRFTRSIAVASLLARVATGVFAQDAGKETSAARKDGPSTTASSSTYDLEIKEGFLVWNGAKRKDNANAVEANLENVVDLLREQHPEANFVVAGGVGGMGISDLKLRAASAEEKLEAVRIAAGSQFLWNDNNHNNRSVIDPATGLPVVDNKFAKAMYVLTELPGTAKPSIQVEAFNIGGHLDSLLNENKENKENKGARQKMIQEWMDELEKMVYETVKQYQRISADLNRSRSTSQRMPSIRFHGGANLVIIIGEPEAVAVAAKVVGAFPGAQRSVALDFQKGENAYRGFGGGSQGGVSPSFAPPPSGPRR